MNEITVAPEKEQELSSRVEMALVEAKSFVISSNEDYIEAGRRRDGLKAIESFVYELVDAPTKAAHALWKSLVAKRDRFLGPIEDARKAYKTSMFKWEDAQEQVRKAEEARLAAEAKKKAEQEQLNRAAAMEAAGQDEEAQAIINEPVAAPVVVLEKSTPKVQGHTRRMVNKYRVVNEALVPRQYLKLDDSKIGGVVRSLGLAANIPGISVYQEPA